MYLCRWAIKQLFNINFVPIKQLSLAYTFPLQFSFLNNCAFSISIIHVFTWYLYDLQVYKVRILICNKKGTNMTKEKERKIRHFFYKEGYQLVNKYLKKIFFVYKRNPKKKITCVCSINVLKYLCKGEYKRQGKSEDCNFT